MNHAGKLELLATKHVAFSDNMYQVVDFLNKTLKHKKLMFGLALAKENPQEMVLSVYEVE